MQKGGGAGDVVGSLVISAWEFRSDTNMVFMLDDNSKMGANVGAISVF